MGSLGEAIAQVQVYMGNHPGIRAAPRYPPGKLAIFPISVAYPGESEVHGGPMGVINGLYTVVIELHQQRTDLEKDVEILTDYSESVPKLLFDKHWNDGYCGRRFYPVTETNHFTRTTPYIVLVEDLLTVTTLKTDADGDRTYESTWAATDYDLEPYNAARLSPARPYTRIVTAPNGVHTFPNMRRGIEIAGSWGFSATTPPAVKEACLLQCERLFLRKDTPFGVTGSAEMGHMTVIPKLDPDVKLLLDPFKKIGL